MHELSVFCQNLTQLRSSIPVSRAEMAGLLEISEVQLASIEDGTVPPEITADILYRIYTLFGIRPNLIFSPNFHP